MFKKLSNTILLLLLLLLLGVFAFVQYRAKSSGMGKSNYKAELATIDTAAVSAILLYPQAIQGDEIKLERSGGGWNLTSQGETQAADAQKVAQLLFELGNLKSKRLASKNPAQQAEYKVDAAQSTRVKVMEGDKTALDLHIGKFSFQQAKQPQLPEGAPQNMGGQQRPILTSYVRPEGANEIYAVDGILNMAFNRKAEDLLPAPPPTAPADSTAVEATAP